MKLISSVVLSLAILQCYMNASADTYKLDDSGVSDIESETESIPGADEVDVSSYDNMYIEPEQADITQSAPKQETQEVKTAVPKDELVKSDIDIIVNKLKMVTYELDQLANRTSIPLRDRAVCRLLWAAYRNLELYVTEMKNPMKDLKLFLTYVDLCIGNIHFLYSPKMIIGITASTGQKLKELRYKYVEIKKAQGILLDILEKTVIGIADSLEMNTEEQAKSIFFNVLKKNTVL